MNVEFYKIILHYALCILHYLYAGMAELADAYDSGSYV